MNLTLHDGEDGPEIELWQTPTHITWMCLSYNPETKEPDGGHEGVRRRYLEWVKGQLPHIDDDFYYWQKDRIKEHTGVINSVKQPYFSYI